MESGTLRDPKVIEALKENFVNARLYLYNGPEKDPENYALLSKFFDGSDKAAPVFVFASKNNDRLVDFNGIVSVDDFMKYLKQALATH